MSELKLKNFDFDYPKELIAKYPLKDRASARLLVIDREKRSIEHKHVFELPEYFDSEDLIVANDTKVFPARLFGKRADTGGRAEVFLVKEFKSSSEKSQWKAMLNINKKVRVGLSISIGDELLAKVVETCVEYTPTPLHLLELSKSGNELYELLYKLGTTPLPPYIKREADENDKITYQTVYAENTGAVAAPTAGLHFTSEILQQIEDKGAKISKVTLHVGLGTFVPVEHEDITEHEMHSEDYSVNTKTYEILKAHLEGKKPITSIGTTSLRTIESLLQTQKLSGSTDLYIYPGYQFKGVSKLMTNFHRPKSTLFMLVSAFAGTEFMKECYQEAFKEKYRLFSYGDAMLIL